MVTLIERIYIFRFIQQSAWNGKRDQDRSIESPKVREDHSSFGERELFKTEVIGVLSEPIELFSSTVIRGPVNQCLAKRK